MTAPVAHPDRFFIGGEWVAPSSTAKIDVIDSHSEEVYFSVAEAQAADMDRAIAAAREAFDNGPWPFLSHSERAEYLRALGKEVAARADALGDIWPRESGILAIMAKYAAPAFATVFDYYADLATTFAWEERAQPTGGGAFGLVVREPVGVVGAIIPWNAPIQLAIYKMAPAMLAGCTVVLKASPEAPGAAYLLAEAAEAAGLPAGVFNVLTADREVSERLVTDPRIDKIAFTGSTAAGRRIASLCGERIARYTLELGGKSAAVILDDANLDEAIPALLGGAILINGEACVAQTR
ncbi:MAG: aldehyde dehydrogenase family protein, partial [Mycobacteriales bacterium]